MKESVFEELVDNKRWGGGVGMPSGRASVWRELEKLEDRAKRLAIQQDNGTELFFPSGRLHSKGPVCIAAEEKLSC